MIICSLFLIARTIEDLIEVLFLEENNEEMLKPRQRLERRISQGNSYPLPMLVTEILAFKIWWQFILECWSEILFDVVWDHRMSPTFQNCHHHKIFCNWYFSTDTTPPAWSCAINNPPWIAQPASSAPTRIPTRKFRKR